MKCSQMVRGFWMWNLSVFMPEKVQRKASGGAWCSITSIRAYGISFWALT